MELKQKTIIITKRLYAERASINNHSAAANNIFPCNKTASIASRPSKAMLKTLVHIMPRATLGEGANTQTNPEIAGIDISSQRTIS
jgi:hypothetical protein